MLAPTTNLRNGRAVQEREFLAFLPGDQDHRAAVYLLLTKPLSFRLPLLSVTSSTLMLPLEDQELCEGELGSSWPPPPPLVALFDLAPVNGASGICD